MGASYLSLSAACTVLSFVGLQCWTTVSLERLRSDGLVGDTINAGDASHALNLLLGSYATIALVANFVLNVFVLLILSLKVIILLHMHPQTIFDRWRNDILFEKYFTNVLRICYVFVCFFL